jgi:hypothetical protein
MTAIILGISHCKENEDHHGQQSDAGNDGKRTIHPARRYALIRRAPCPVGSV